MDHILDQNKNLDNLKIFKFNGVCFLTVTNRSKIIGKYQRTWKFNRALQNNQWVREEKPRETRTYFEVNENDNLAVKLSGTHPQKWSGGKWNRSEVYMKYNRPEERSQQNDLNMHLKETEKH